MSNPDVLATSKLKNEGPRFYMPSDKERDLVENVFSLFRDTADSRNRRFDYFDQSTLIEYIEDSVHRFVTNIYEREGIEDWQAAVNTQFTRSKVLAILGKVMQVLPIANFTGRGEEDARKGVLLTNLYEYTEELDDYEELMTHILLESILKGTAIGYEDVEYSERKLRDVEGIGDDLKITEITEKETRLYGAIVPLEEFYPSSVSVRKISDMPFCFWRQVVPYKKFLQGWSNYAQHTKVQPRQTFTDSENTPYYNDYISDDVNEGSVELIKYYDKQNDEYVILANGIWLNPLDLTEQGEARQEISPLPWAHKELPFWDVKFDFFASNFFYGKSLPDRLKSLQDVLNVLNNMLLDQSFLTIFPPILTNGFDDIEDDYLRPGRRTPIDTQGLPINQAIMPLDMATPNGWHQFILEYTEKTMEQASLDKVSSGQAGAGDRTTAQEVRIAADGVSALLQLFARMINYGIKRKARLKAANILQFGLDPNTPMIRRIGGEDGDEDFNSAFNVFTIEGAVLSEGKRGTKIIEIYRDKENLPNKEEVVARAEVAQVNTGKNFEIDALPHSYMRNFLFDVTLILNPKNEASKEMEKALQLEKVQVYLNFFPEMVDKEELFAQTAEKLGDDPTKIMKDEALNPPPPQGEGGAPGTANANNMVRSAQGGQGGASDQAAIAGSITG